MKEVCTAGNQLSRNQRDADRRLASLRPRKDNMKPSGGLFSIAAARHKTAKTSEALGQCDRGHKQIKIFHKTQLLNPAVDQPSGDSADDASVNHKAFPYVFPERRIGDKGREFYDNIEKFRP